MTNEDIAAALAEPFEASEVKFKPAVVSGNRAMALAYVDARVIQDRLDDVFGIGGWSDDYQVLEGGSVVCKLTCKFPEGNVTKVDVGSQSEQPDDGDKMKAAFSDALKRAAVKFGVGRYLYRLPSQWVDYDPRKRQFTKPPQLPAAAVPQKKTDTRNGGLEVSGLMALRPASRDGIAALTQAWSSITHDQRRACMPYWAGLKADAALADMERSKNASTNG